MSLSFLQSVDAFLKAPAMTEHASTYEQSPHPVDDAALAKLVEDLVPNPWQEIP